MRFLNIIWYKSVKTYAAIALQFYFRKLEVKGLENVPRSGPLLMISNHQNAFLDAVLLTCTTPRSPYFLTRAGVFKRPVARWILNSLRLIPIFRIRDGLGNVKRNDETFDKSLRILEKGGAMIIFPEGNHDGRYHLRDFQRGVARIALGTKEDLPLQILPVGIQYDSLAGFRSRVLVTYETPVTITDYREQYKEAPRGAIDQLKDDLEEKIRPLILDFPDKDYSVLAEKFQSNRVLHKDLTVQLKEDQKLATRIIASPQDYTANPVSPPPRPWYFWLDVGMWYGAVNHFLPWLLLRAILKGALKTDQFLGSLKFACGMILVPIFYTLQTLGVYLLSDWVWALLYFLTLWPSGLYAFTRFNKKY